MQSDIDGETMHWLKAGKPVLPVLCAPMFLVSGLELLLAQCKAGLVGSLPALNARGNETLDDWLAQINEELANVDRDQHPDSIATYAINLIVHRSNAALEDQLAACVRHKVPVIITSMGSNPDVNAAVHDYGGVVLHDVTNVEHARKAIERGADGLIAVAAGAGGHAGTLSPFALVQEIRSWWSGPLLLSGAIATGGAILAAQAMGADMAYCGSCFIAASESRAPDTYRQAVIESSAADIIYTDRVSGTPANFLRSSLERHGVDWTDRSFSLADDVKAWRDVWSAGHAIGTTRAIKDVQEIVSALKAEYVAAMAAICRRTPRMRALNDE